MHPADVIIYGTGFAASDFLAPMMFTGRGRQPLTEAWAGGARAYFGLTVPGFPNMLIMYGPNTNTGGGSIVHFLETQARYVRAFVDHVAATSAAWEIKPEIEAGFDTETQSRLAGSVWARCSSWYRSDSGRITANWPGLSAEYRRRARFRPAEYQRAAARSPRLERAAH
jgi:cation diffusion facilitator CzcD-associated flavoprotein CzcO